MSRAKERVGRPIIIGEVLFDRFPDETRVLGGAPFNVAWHLQGFGEEPLFGSRVGDDPEGERVRAAMAAWGMDQTGVETDTTYPTGAVDIRFSGSQHTFEILPEQAYDRVSRQQLDSAVGQADAALLYLGTLISRTEDMRESLAALFEKTDAPLFVDVNLREPWWRDEDFPWLLNRSRWVKVNDEELVIIGNTLGLSDGNLDVTARRLQERFAIELLIVTLGSKGARAFPAAGAPVEVVPEPAKRVVDTVGAGDAFASVSVIGLLRAWPSATILQRAQQFASQVVQQRGATARDREPYDRLLREWQLP